MECFKKYVSTLNVRHIIPFFRYYPCDVIPVIGVVLFKTCSPDAGEREKSAQLLQLLER